MGVVNSPNLPWDTDTRRAIESKTVYKLHSLGIKVVNGANSTWTNGGTVHPNVNNQYVEDVSNIIVDYITHHTGYMDNRLLAIENSEKATDLEAKVISKRKSFTPNPVSLEMLMASGNISECDLYSVQPLYPAQARLTSKGTVIFDGYEYTSISSSAIAAIRKTRADAISTNGWEFWGILQSDGKIKKLSSYRDEYK